MAIIRFIRVILPVLLSICSLYLGPEVGLLGLVGGLIGLLSGGVGYILLVLICSKLGLFELLGLLGLDLEAGRMSCDPTLGFIGKCLLWLYRAIPIRPVITGLSEYGYVRGLLGLHIASLPALGASRAIMKSFCPGPSFPLLLLCCPKCFL